MSFIGDILGGGGGGDGGDALIRQQQEEEARKAELRKRIALLFGEGPDTERVKVGTHLTGPRVNLPVAGRTMNLPSPFGRATTSAAGVADDGAGGRRGRRTMVGPDGRLMVDMGDPDSGTEWVPAEESGLPGYAPSAQYEDVFEDRPSEAALARQRFGAEESELSGALRGQYGDDLKKVYERMERALRFGAARTGNIGGSVYADAQSDLEEENRMGGTRIAEATQRAINQLRGNREDSKLRALQLVNAGTGEEAVQAARSGLTQALDTAKSAQREDLFSDLFNNLAFTKVAGDARARDAGALDYFRNMRRGSLTPQAPSVGGGRLVNY